MASTSPILDYEFQTAGFPPTALDGDGRSPVDVESHHGEEEKKPREITGPQEEGRPETLAWATGEGPAKQEDRRQEGARQGKDRQNDETRSDVPAATGSRGFELRRAV